jgi:hypothetical protein
MAALALVVCGAALMPAPVRARHAALPLRARLAEGAA